MQRRAVQLSHLGETFQGTSKLDMSCTLRTVKRCNILRSMTTDILGIVIEEPPIP